MMGFAYAQRAAYKTWFKSEIPKMQSLITRQIHRDAAGDGEQLQGYTSHAGRQQNCGLVSVHAISHLQSSEYMRQP